MGKGWGRTGGGLARFMVRFTSGEIPPTLDTARLLPHLPIRAGALEHSPALLTAHGTANQVRSHFQGKHRKLLL